MTGSAIWSYSPSSSIHRVRPAPPAPPKLAADTVRPPSKSHPRLLHSAFYSGMPPTTPRSGDPVACLCRWLGACLAPLGAHATRKKKKKKVHSSCRSRSMPRFPFNPLHPLSSAKSPSNFYPVLYLASGVLRTKVHPHLLARAANSWVHILLSLWPWACQSPPADSPYPLSTGW